MARLQTAVLAVALFGLLAVAAAESSPRKLLGWDVPTVQTTTSYGKLNVRPYAVSGANFVGGNWVFPNWWVSGFPEATGGGKRKLAGWDVPTVQTTTSYGKLNVRPYSWNVQNFVGGNWVFPNWWVSGFPEATGGGK